MKIKQPAINAEFKQNLFIEKSNDITPNIRNMHHSILHD